MEKISAVENENQFRDDWQNIDKVRLARIVNTALDLDLTQDSLIRINRVLYCDRNNEPDIPMAGDSKSLTVTLSVPDEASFEIKECTLNQAQEGFRVFCERLNKLIAVKTPFSSIYYEAWKIFHANPYIDVAAGIIHFTLAYGSHDEIIDTFKSIIGWNRDVYWGLQPKVRETLVLLFWNQKRSKDLIAIFADNANGNRLLPLEKVMQFYGYIGTGDILLAFDEYNQFRDEMMEAVVQFGEKVALSSDKFSLDVGRQALKLGYERSARKIFSQIHKESRCHSIASELLLAMHPIEKDDSNKIFIEFKRKNNYKQKIRMLREYLEKARKVGPIMYEQRGNLDALLLRLSKFMSYSGHEGEETAKLLVEFASIERFYPGYFGFFTNIIRNFSSFDDEIKGWSPLLSIKTGDKGVDKFWQGIAHFHVFISGKMRYEAHLWDAFECFEYIDKKWNRPAKIKWEELNGLGCAAIAADTSLAEGARELLITRLNILNDPESVPASEFEKVLRSCENFPGGSVQKIRSLVEKMGKPELEIKVIRSAAHKNNYTNADLERLWHLSCIKSDNNLAWSIATVLLSRKKLHPMVHAAWKLTFEGRKEFVLLSPPPEILLSIFSDLSSAGQKILRTIPIIAPRILELFVQIDDRVKKSKLKNIKDGSMESQAELQMAMIPWIGRDNYIYHMSNEYIPQNYVSPPFMKIFPDNNWSWLILSLARRFGLAYFDWSITKMIQSCSAVCAHSCREPLHKKSRIYGNWVSTLTSKEKTAWNDLIGFKNILDETEAKTLLSVLLIRLATVIYPSHFEALCSLQVMGADLQILRGLEQFLLSTGYQKVRVEIGSFRATSVPVALMRLSTVCQENESD